MSDLKMSKGANRIEDALRPLCLLNGVLGMTIIEIPVGRPWPKLSFFYAIAKGVVYFYFLWYAHMVLHSHYSEFAIMLTVTRVITYGNIIIAVISNIFGFINQKKYRRFARKITLADETLAIFGIDPDYNFTHRKIKKAILTWCTISVVIIVGDFTMGLYLYDTLFKSVVKGIVFEVPLLMNLMIELNFIVKISILGKRFERLNALLKSVTCIPLQTDYTRHYNEYQNIMKNYKNKVDIKPNFYHSNRNNIELVLRTARQLHLDLCATAREVNDTYSKTLSMQMAATFLLLTGFGYCVYLVYSDIHCPLSEKSKHFCSLGIWIIASVFRIIHVVRVSVNVTAEAQKTSQIAHEIQVSKWQKKIIDEIHQLSLQIMQHPLYFTGSGLIVLDFGYVRGFVGSVTTYLMILIQNQPDMIKAANTLVEGSSENITDSLK